MSFRGVAPFAADRRALPGWFGAAGPSRWGWLPLRDGRPTSFASNGRGIGRSLHIGWELGAAHQRRKD